jgi:hypothetical protein
LAGAGLIQPQMTTNSIDEATVGTTKRLPMSSPKASQQPPVRRYTHPGNAAQRVP